MYNWIANIVNAPYQGANSTYVYIAGVIIVLTLCLTYKMLYTAICRLHK